MDRHFIKLMIRLTGAVRVSLCNGIVWDWHGIPIPNASNPQAWVFNTIELRHESTTKERNRMRQYIYETHLHTQQASKCSDSQGRTYIQKYIDAGFSGVMVTDHFFRGNSSIDRSLPWQERIKLFSQGYEDARNEGAKRNFPVFFGWEENFDEDEYLIYGPDEDWMIHHPEMEYWTRAQQYEQVHQAGGCVVQAHPFRARKYIRAIHLSAFCVDAVEGVNLENDPVWNTLAIRYAHLLGLPVTAGSDNHHADTMRPGLLAGVVFGEPLESIHSYVSSILERKPFSLHVPVGIPSWNEATPIPLPVELMGDNDQHIEVDIRRFLRTGRF